MKPLIKRLHREIYSDTKLRTKFSKLLSKSGAIRLQYSVYEVNNTNRVLDNLMLKIEQFASKFDGGDSVIIFNVSGVKLRKYGNAIHRDVDIVYI
jgi:CRISPR-associated protein Cas2